MISQLIRGLIPLAIMFILTYFMFRNLGQYYVVVSWIISYLVWGVIITMPMSWRDRL